MTKIEYEKSRCYVFPHPSATDSTLYSDYQVDNVVDLVVSKSGGHRLTTKEGGMVYIPPKWIAIEIRSDKGWEI